MSSGPRRFWSEICELGIPELKSIILLEGPESSEDLEYCLASPKMLCKAIGSGKAG
jgi:hypothetical protein